MTGSRTFSDKRHCTFSLGTKPDIRNDDPYKKTGFFIFTKNPVIFECQTGYLFFLPFKFNGYCPVRYS
jgi:hypothetical protein